MDNNHIPSSPLHHRRPSSRPSTSNHPDPTPPLPPIEPARLPSRGGATSPITTSSATTTIQPVERGIEWSAPWDHHMSSDGIEPQSDPVGSGTGSGIASTSLLTSRPLDRSASSLYPPPPHPSPSHTHSPPRPQRKRRRAASLPTPDPIYKRCRLTTTPTPSDVWERTLLPRKRERTRLDYHIDLANRYGRRLFRRRQYGGTVKYISAIRQPPINLTTLRSLDACEILKNAQLRHDLLFDTLAFRPVTPANTVPISSEIFTGGTRVSSSDPRANGAVADMYWDAIQREITTGCRCTRWKVLDEAQAAAGAVALENREEVCVCGRWMEDFSEADWWARSQAWPSRLPDMIKTLREVLISLMGSTTPCANHFAHSFSREALEAHERVCPTVTHALVPELFAALDPEFITSQVRRGVYDFERVFGIIGEAMKVHCAPVRDGMVNHMVQIAQGGNVCVGLRLCFECVEVMKLDIANHQVHALRPHLWTSANQHEYAAFQSYLGSKSRTCETSLTRKWIRGASFRVLAASDPRERTHLVGKCSCGNNDELVFKSLAEGFMELVSQDWSGNTWPPVLQKRMASTLAQESAVGIEVPEVFKMDTRRIRNFHAEMVEICITAAIQIIFKNAIIAVRPKSTSRELKAYADLVREDIESFSAQGQITSEEIITDLALSLATRIHKQTADTRTFNEAEQVCDTPSSVRIDSTAQTLGEILGKALQRDSVMFKTVFKNVRQGMTLILRNTLLGYRLDERSPFYSAALGLGQKCLGDGQVVESKGDTVDDAEEEYSTDSESDESDTPVPTNVQLRIRQRHQAFLLESRQSEKALLRKTGLSSSTAQDSEGDRAMPRLQRVSRSRPGSVIGSLPGGGTGASSDKGEEAIRELVGRMSRIVGFNLGVFGGVYARKGMCVSGA